MNRPLSFTLTDCNSLGVGVVTVRHDSRVPLGYVERGGNVSELVLEHEPFTDDEGVRYCACGCGTELRPDAKRSYIHGHKLRMEEGRTPEDPEPSDEAKAKGTVRVTAKVRKEMQDSIAAYFAFGAGAWSMSDPLCGQALVDQSEEIAARLVPILARNQAAVRYFRSSSSFKDGMDLMLAIWPVAVMIGKHHVFHTVGTVESNDGHAPARPLNSFVA